MIRGIFRKRRIRALLLFHHALTNEHDENNTKVWVARHNLVRAIQEKETLLSGLCLEICPHGSAIDGIHGFPALLCELRRQSEEVTAY